ncbi:MAG: thioredoxin fold domain-containing protein [Bacteroidetes bacterium]|nr:thioredoxin fold domain-containing protein [Bacteroidota bacterium]
MKSYLLFFLPLLMLSCMSNAQKLSPQAFEAGIKSTPHVQVLDVRTPKEFAGGHIQNALNVDWNSDQFRQGISGLDKARPVYVYCLSGGRSADAAADMRKMGFQKVFELKGGMLNWRSAHLPETGSDVASNGAAQAKGLTMAQFKNMLSSDKLVLVDFHAEWCKPCKKMAPYLDQIATEMKDKVVVLRIDADDNEALATEMKIVGLPFLQLYKNKEQSWQHMGYMDKAELEAIIRQHL